MHNNASNVGELINRSEAFFRFKMKTLFLRLYQPFHSICF